jgi:hypothetical protein
MYTVQQGDSFRTEIVNRQHGVPVEVASIQKVAAARVGVLTGGIPPLAEDEIVSAFEEGKLLAGAKNNNLNA